MGFYNIYLEGQQAEEYKARKAKEAEKEEKEHEDYMNNRYAHRGAYGALPNHIVGTKSYSAYKDGKIEYDANNQRVNDFDRAEKAYDMVSKDVARRNNNGGKIIPKQMISDDNVKAFDAANRHIRRHPEKYNESSIFESVVFLNEGLFSKKKPKKKDPIMMNDPIVKELSEKLRKYVESKINTQMNKTKYDIYIDETPTVLDDGDEWYGVSIYEKKYNKGTQDEYSEAEYQKLLDEIEQMREKAWSWAKSAGCKENANYKLTYKNENIELYIDTTQLSLDIAIIYHV